jgi:hypothetical protein
VVSLWQETGDKLQLLQSQSISEQPVNCLDWNRDKPGESVSLNAKENICTFSSLDDIFQVYKLLTLMKMALLTPMSRVALNL